MTIGVLQAAPVEPTAAEMERVERGEAVQVLTEAPGSPWPRSTVHVFIEATPEQSAAVLSDYDLQSAYTPKMKTSRVLRRWDNQVHVEYVISVPIYPDERTVSHQRLSRTDDTYRIEWNTVADSTWKGSVTRGSATFRPMINRRTGKAGTLMTHDQSVKPASMFARVPMVRGKAIEAHRDAADAVRKQVEKEIASEPARLDAQLKRLRSIVPGK